MLVIPYVIIHKYMLPSCCHVAVNIRLCGSSKESIMFLLGRQVLFHRLPSVSPRPSWLRLVIQTRRRFGAVLMPLQQYQRPRERGNPLELLGVKHSSKESRFSGWSLGRWNLVCFKGMGECPLFVGKEVWSHTWGFLLWEMVLGKNVKVFVTY